MDGDVPLLVPEVNADHLDLLPEPPPGRALPNAIVANPNCSTIGLVLALKPLAASFGIRRVSVVTLAGGFRRRTARHLELPDPGQRDSLDSTRGGRSSKSRRGRSSAASRATGSSPPRSPCPHSATGCPWSTATHSAFPSISAAAPASPRCVRPGVHSSPSHRGSVCLRRRSNQPSTWVTTSRPQARIHRDLGRGMTVAVGRLRECPVLDFRFVALSHNTLRGAAGGAMLAAELVVARSGRRPARMTRFGSSVRPCIRLERGLRLRRSGLRIAVGRQGQVRPRRPGDGDQATQTRIEPRRGPDHEDHRR